MYRMAFLVSIVAIALAACGGGAAGVNGSPNVSLPAMNAGPATSSGTPIKHIVIVIQENRSFDNLFARYPGADGATEGKNYNGQTVELTAHALTSNLVLNNSHLAWITDYDNGKMDGFGLVYVNGHRCTCAYQYVKSLPSSRIGRWRSSTCWPTTCFKRRAAEVSPRIRI